MKEAVRLEYYELIPFLQTFFDPNTGQLHPYKPKIRVRLDWNEKATPLDIKWLAAFLRAHPRVGLTFINQNSESRDINILFGNIGSGSDWYDHRDDFASVTLQRFERTQQEDTLMSGRRKGRQRMRAAQDESIPRHRR